MQYFCLLDEFSFKLTKFEIVQQTNDIFRIFLENKGSIDDSRIRVEDWYRHLRKYSNRNYKWSLSRRIISFRGISPRSRRNPKQRHYTPIFLYTIRVRVRVCVCSLDPLSIPRGEIRARAKGVLSHAMLFIILLTSPETIVFGIVSGDCLAPVVSKINDRYSITHTVVANDFTLCSFSFYLFSFFEKFSSSMSRCWEKIKKKIDPSR